MRVVWIQFFIRQYFHNFVLRVDVRHTDRLNDVAAFCNAIQCATGNEDDGGICNVKVQKTVSLQLYWQGIIQLASQEVKLSVWRLQSSGLVSTENFFYLFLYHLFNNLWIVQSLYCLLRKSQLSVLVWAPCVEESSVMITPSEWLTFRNCQIPALR